MGRVCDFAGVTFEPEMSRFRGHEVHNIGGNRMRLARAQDIEEDVKWRTELNSEQLEIFEGVGDRLNRELLGGR